jgi:hypothetical protein
MRLFQEKSRLNMMQQLKAKIVILLLAIVCISCQQQEIGLNKIEVPIEKFSALQSIKDYLHQKVAIKGFDGKVYCEYDVLDAEIAGVNGKLYLWAFCQEYYREGQKLEAGTGGSFPVVLKIRQENNQIEVVGHQKPRDGSLYTADMPVMFSKKALAIVAADPKEQNKRVVKMQNQIKQSAGIK